MLGSMVHRCVVDVNTSQGHSAYLFGLIRRIILRPAAIRFARTERTGAARTAIRDALALAMVARRSSSQIELEYRGGCRALISRPMLARRIRFREYGRANTGPFRARGSGAASGFGSDPAYQRTFVGKMRTTITPLLLIVHCLPKKNALAFWVQGWTQSAYRQGSARRTQVSTMLGVIGRVD